jgi:hypothetical protein
MAINIPIITTFSDAGIGAAEAGMGMGAGGMMGGLPEMAGIGAAEMGTGMGASAMGGVGDRGGGFWPGEPTRLGSADG